MRKIRNKQRPVLGLGKYWKEVYCLKAEQHFRCCLHSQLLFNKPEECLIDVGRVYIGLLTRLNKTRVLKVNSSNPIPAKNPQSTEYSDRFWWISMWSKTCEKNYYLESFGSFLLWIKSLYTFIIKPLCFPVIKIRLSAINWTYSQTHVYSFQVKPQPEV